MTPLSEIPIPKATSGLQLLKACLSKDGKAIAVSGSPSFVASKFDLKAWEVSPEHKAQAIALIRLLLGGSLWESTYPPTNSNYRARATFSTLGYVTALAFSQTAPHRIAYIARESQAKIPPETIEGMAEPEIASLFKDTIADLTQKPFREVLYVVSSQEGKSREICTVREHVPPEDFLHRTKLSVTALCWSGKDDSLIYVSNNGVYRVSLAGNMTSLYDFVETRCISQPRVDRESFSFVEQVFIGPPSLSTLRPQLTTFSYDGAVLSRQLLARFNPETPELVVSPTPQSESPAVPAAHAFVPEIYNLAVIGDKKYATLDRNVDPHSPNKFPAYTLRVRSLEKGETVLNEQVLSDANIPYTYSLVAFTPQDNALVFAKKVNCPGKYDSVEEMPAVKAEKKGLPLSQLLLLSLE